jgi:hypothetical protein
MKHGGNSMSKASKGKGYQSHGSKEVNGKAISMTNKGAFGLSPVQKRESANKKREKRHGGGVTW